MKQDIWLIWVSAGEYSDSELTAARTSPESAKSWCNEHRKLSSGDPVQWDGDRGTSRFEFSFRNKKTRMTYIYYIEKFLLED